MMNFSTLLVTGGCGFIGSNFVRLVLERAPNTRVVVLDKMTYAARRENLKGLEQDSRLEIVVGDIGNLELVRYLVSAHRIDAIVNFAAETHVDQSILNPLAFTDANVRGTHALLEVAREFKLRFHHVSTDEVYGHIEGEHQSTESDPLVPRSPYSASKAASDHLVHAYFVTYGLHATITRGSNTVGPYQFPEKVIPLFATNALQDLPLPVYGDGQQMRDYMHAADHCSGILMALERGLPGQVYNVGTGKDMTNLSMVEIVLSTLGKPQSLIRHVTDRPGHDRRYSMNVSKLRALGWTPQFSPQEAVAAAARWYAQNDWWWRPIREGEFSKYYERQYGQRLSEASA